MTHIVKGMSSTSSPSDVAKDCLRHGHTANAIVGGWSLNGDFHYNTGTPISVHSQNSYPGFNGVYVNIVPDASSPLVVVSG